MFQLLLPNGDMVRAKRVRFQLQGVVSLEQFELFDYTKGVYKLKEGVEGYPIDYINFSKKALEEYNIEQESGDVVNKDVVRVALVPELFDYISDSVDTDVIICVEFAEMLGGCYSVVLFANVDSASAIQEELFCGRVADMSYLKMVKGSHLANTFDDVMTYQDVVYGIK